MSDSFWAGGSDAYADGLKKHYDSALRDLRDKMKQCSDESTRAEIKIEIERTEAEYRGKLKDIDNLLF